MQIHQNKLIIGSRPKSLINITDQVKALCIQNKISNGLCQLYVCHTSCSITISENFDPDVLLDLEDFMSDMIPESRDYRHCAEGLDDMPAHIRSVLTQTQISIPVIDGQLGLGRWQAIYLWEHRSHAHERQIMVTFMGE